jgi:hypothetical protein
VTGYNALVTLRATLHRAVNDLGVRVEFAPETTADVVDWFGLPALSMARGALDGAAIGLLFGAIVNLPVAGLLGGAALGGLAGGAVGVNAVRSGWRVRFGWLPSGEPHAVLEPIG